MFKLPLRILDRLEEVLISSLMAAATVITFVAVVHQASRNTSPAST
jgi:hypothetical protein